MDEELEKIKKIFSVQDPGSWSAIKSALMFLAKRIDDTDDFLDELEYKVKSLQVEIDKLNETNKA